MPVFGVRIVPLDAPGGIASNTSDTNQQVHLAHYFGENDSRHVGQAQRRARHHFKAARFWSKAEKLNTTRADGAINRMTRGFSIIRKVHIEFSAKSVGRQLQIRRVMGIPLPHQVKLPATLPAQRGELVLAYDVRSETVGECL